MILKKEVASQRNKNVDILNISSLICHKLSGKITTLIHDKSDTLNISFRSEVHKLSRWPGQERHGRHSRADEDIIQRIQSQGGRFSKYNKSLEKVSS